MRGRKEVVMRLTSEKTAPLFLAMSAVFWSLGGIFTKSVAWNGLCLATVRGIISCLVSLAVLRRWRIKITPVKLLVAFCYFMQGILLLSANKYTTAANATVLQNTSPLYILLFNAVIAKQYPKRRDILACGFLFLGISLAFVGNMGGGGAVGNLMALCSGLFYAGVFFFSRQSGADPLESLVLGNALYFLLIPALIMNETVRATTWANWLFIICFATLSGAVAWLCFARGIKDTQSLQASFITMLEPILAPTWTFFLLGEKISITSLIGCGIVVVTLVVYNIRQIKSTSVIPEKT